jgi:serine/threonine protein phosphatase 1
MSTEAPSAGFGPPQPEVPVYVVGDIHGRSDLLDRMLGLIDDDIHDRGVAETARVVVAGDVIDRGPQTKAVVDTLFELTRLMPRRVTVLLGNHERMMLDFLERPEGPALGWLRHGGLETLLSYGIGGIGPAPSPDRAGEAAARLAEALTPEVLGWLSRLPLQDRSGNVGFVHAGANPFSPFDLQAPDDLVWGHPAFLEQPRRDGLWIAYGHTIVEQPHARDGRIAVDTGAWSSDRLTAAAIWRGEVRFLQT